MKRFLILGLTIRNVATIFEMVDWIFNIYTDLVSIFPFFRATFYARIGTERNKSITKSNVFEDRKSNKKSCLKRVNLEPSKSQKSRSSWEYSRNAIRSVSVGIEKNTLEWKRSIKLVWCIFGNSNNLWKLQSCYYQSFRRILGF